MPPTLFLMVYDVKRTWLQVICKCIFFRSEHTTKKGLRDIIKPGATPFFVQQPGTCPLFALGGGGMGASEKIWPPPPHVTTNQCYYPEETVLFAAIEWPFREVTRHQNEGSGYCQMISPPPSLLYAPENNKIHILIVYQPGGDILVTKSVFLCN